MSYSSRHGPPLMLEVYFMAHALLFARRLSRRSSAVALLGFGSLAEEFKTTGGRKPAWESRSGDSPFWAGARPRRYPTTNSSSLTRQLPGRPGPGPSGFTGNLSSGSPAPAATISPSPPPKVINGSSGWSDEGGCRSLRQSDSPG